MSVSSTFPGFNRCRNRPPRTGISSLGFGLFLVVDICMRMSIVAEMGLCIQQGVGDKDVERVSLLTKDLESDAGISRLD